MMPAVFALYRLLGAGGDRQERRLQEWHAVHAGFGAAHRGSLAGSYYHRRPQLLLPAAARILRVGPFVHRLLASLLVRRPPERVPSRLKPPSSSNCLSVCLLARTLCGTAPTSSQHYDSYAMLPPWFRWGAVPRPRHSITAVMPCCRHGSCGVRFPDLITALRQLCHAAKVPVGRGSPAAVFTTRLGGGSRRKAFSRKFYG
jgi:hypothetical protein